MRARTARWTCFCRLLFAQVIARNSEKHWPIAFATEFYVTDFAAPLLLIAPCVILAGGCAALFCGPSFRACLAARALALPGALLGLLAAMSVLWNGSSIALVLLPWPLPLGQCLFQIDQLAALFLAPLFFLSTIAAWVLPGRARFFEDQTHLGRHCFFFCLLAASMALVILAADGLFFLLLWEIMSLAPFFLLVHNDKSSTERYASWIYLVAAHLGALPLLFFFCSLTVQTGSSGFLFYTGQSFEHAGLLFVLALVGFGAKSGLFPLHMWMPEAHSSAPGHVAVLLSGAMLNVGIYGIMRSLNLLGAFSLDLAYPLMVLGAISGVMGILLGLGQADMKRTLAYSSADNMGIILMALGGVFLAASHQAQTALFLLLIGLFLHIWNHSLFKSLLFLGANAVKESTRVTTLQRLGGLAGRMPATSGCFAVGSAAIAGVPPLNGFLGELLIFLGFAVGARESQGTETVFVFWVAFFVLATIAGFSMFAFTRVFGLTFLGAARSPEAAQAKDPGPTLRRAMIILAFCCLGISLAAPFMLPALLYSPLAWFTPAFGLPGMPFAEALDFAEAVVSGYALAALVLLLLLGLCFLIRKIALGGKSEATSSTWGCGYIAPSTRMQYTGGSFAHSAVLLLKPLIRAELETPKDRSPFPAALRARMSVPDWPTAAWTKIFFRPVALLAEKSKDLQHGLLNIYILYILTALVAALVWALGVA